MISSNPYEKKSNFDSFEWSRGSFEWPKERDLSPQEKQEKERKLNERQQEIIEGYKNAIKLANHHSLIEAKIQAFTNDKYDELLSLPDYMFSDSSLFLSEFKKAPTEELKPKEATKTPEVKQSKTESLSEKEKVKQYGTLANLSYAKFEKVEGAWETSLQNLKVKEVNLDIASIDFTKFQVDSGWKLSVLNPDKTSPEEMFIVSYFNNQDNFKNGNWNMIVDTNDRNISDIIDVALFRNSQELDRIAKLKQTPVQFADASSAIWDTSTTKSDAGNWYDLNRSGLSEEERKVQKISQFIEANRPKLNETLIKLKESKTSEYQSQFKEFQEKWDFKVLAYYPEKWDKDTGWFQCVLFEKDWKKILSIAWTQLSDIWDVKADFAILFWKVPETQTKRMIDFFKKKLNPNEEVTIVGHSLWGTLSQIWSAIFGSAETYTFNSPWAKELSVSVDPNDPYKKELQDFTKNRNYDSIGEKITNVKWSEGFSFIAEKGVDIWNYRIDVKTSSHSITSILEAVEKVDKLTKNKVGWTSEKEEQRQKNY